MASVFGWSSLSSRAVVWQPSDDGVVGRSLAQRRICHLHGVPGHWQCRAILEHGTHIIMCVLNHLSYLLGASKTLSALILLWQFFLFFSSTCSSWRTYPVLSCWTLWMSLIPSSSQSTILTRLDHSLTPSPTPRYLVSGRGSPNHCTSLVQGLPLITVPLSLSVAGCECNSHDTTLSHRGEVLGRHHPLSNHPPIRECWDLSTLGRTPTAGSSSHRVVLEYFAGENLYEWARSAENLTFCDITIAFWQGSCVFTNLGFAICEFINPRKVRICLMLTKHSSNTVYICRPTK